VYRVKHENVIGKTVKELEEMFPGEVVADKIKRGKKLLDPEPSMTIEADDRIALIGGREEFVRVGTMIGPEIEDKSVSDIIGEILDICVLNKDVVGKTLGQLSPKHGHGCFIRKILRQGQEIPVTRDTVINKCDILKVAGTQKDVERLVKEFGYPERPTNATDLVMVGVGCVLGTLLGLLAVRIGDIPLTLGIGGGVLVAGLIAGWLRSLRPTFGQIPTSAQWIFTDFGLSLFIACVGLTAGPKAVEAIKTTGISLFLAGVILTLMPHILGYFFGRGVLRLNPLLTMGALTGAGTATPSLNVLKDEAESSIPALGYTVPYAFGNFLLTVWGTVIIHLM
jgi:putative transport protein